MDLFGEPFELLPREIVEREVVPRLSGPSALALFFVNKRFNKLLDSPNSVLHNWFEEAWDRDNEPPIKEILMNSARYRHWDLFEYFAFSFALPIRSIHPKSFEQVARVLLSGSQLALYKRFCDLAGRKLSGDKAALSVAAQSGSVEIVKAFCASTFIDLKTSMAMNYLLSSAAESGSTELFDWLLEQRSEGSGEATLVYAALQLLLNGHFETLKDFCTKWNLSEEYIFNLISFPDDFTLSNRFSQKILRRKLLLDPKCNLLSPNTEARNLLKACVRAGNYDLFIFLLKNLEHVWVDATMDIDAIEFGQIGFLRRLLRERFKVEKIDMATLYPKFKDELLAAVIVPRDLRVIHFAMEIFGITFDDLRAVRPVKLKDFKGTRKELAFCRALEAEGIVLELDLSPVIVFSIENLEFLIARGSVVTRFVIDSVVSKSRVETLKWVMGRYPEMAPNTALFLRMAVGEGRTSNVKYLLTLMVPGFKVDDELLEIALVAGHNALATFLAATFPHLLAELVKDKTLIRFMNQPGRSAKLENALRWLVKATALSAEDLLSKLQQAPQLALWPSITPERLIQLIFDQVPPN